MGSSEHPAVDGNLDKPKAEAGGRRTRSSRLIVWRSSPKPQADSSSPSRGVSGYPPALNGRCLRASPCSAPLPGASEHQRRADLSSFQRLLKLHARDRLGSAFRVSIPPPPRGSHRVVTCWQGTDTYTKVRGSELRSLPPPNTLNTHGAADVARQSFAHTAVNHSPPNPHRPARPTRALATCSDQRGEGVAE